MLDHTPQQILDVYRVIELAPLKADLNRVSGFLSTHMNAFVRAEMRGEAEYAFIQKRAADQMLDEATRIVRALEEMDTPTAAGGSGQRAELPAQESPAGGDFPPTAGRAGD